MAGQTQETKAKRTREAADIGAMVGRMFKSLANRAGDGDMSALSALSSCEREAGEWMLAAVTNLRAAPWCYSWADIGRELGITKQAAQQRFGG